MTIKKDKKESIRKQIIDASHVYRDKLAGKVFLKTFFVSWKLKMNRFMHLTGVNSHLQAQDFYSKASAAKLTTNQFYFDKQHPFANAKKKLPCLMQLPALTNSLVCVVKETNTVTLTYKVGVANLSFTIGLTENIDCMGNKINEWLLPRTLRVKDKAIENSAYAEFIDFIFMKDASHGKYSDLTYADVSKFPLETIRHLLSQDLLNTLYADNKLKF